QWVRLGLWGEAAATAIAGADLAQASDDEETGRALATGEHTWELWLPAAQAEKKVRALSTQAQPLPSKPGSCSRSAWVWGRCAAAPAKASFRRCSTSSNWAV